MDDVGRDWMKSLARIDVCGYVGLGLGHSSLLTSYTVASEFHMAKQSLRVRAYKYYDAIVQEIPVIEYHLISRYSFQTYLNS